MPKVDVADVEEGMTLASDVVNFNGQMLIPKGAQIVEKHLILLKTWGVEHIEIDQGEEALPAALSEGELQIITGQLNDLFRGIQKNNSWMEHLFQLCLERKAKILKSKGSHVS